MVSGYEPRSVPEVKNQTHVRPLAEHRQNVSSLACPLASTNSNGNEVDFSSKKRKESAMCDFAPAPLEAGAKRPRSWL